MRWDVFVLLPLQLTLITFPVTNLFHNWIQTDMACHCVRMGLFKNILERFGCSELGISLHCWEILQINFSAAFDRVTHQGILYRLSSVGIGGSVLSVQLYWRSSFLIDHSMFCWMDVAVNWSMLCQECCRAVFCGRCCSFWTPRNFFPFWRISLLVMLMTPLWWVLCYPQALELR